jgi:hypothetical protein
MPTLRTFSLDVDTKKYLNRVNVYRALNGLSNIRPEDAADIDNFVVGLKDLGVWGNTLCFLLRSTQNIGVGTSFFPIGGASGNNVGYMFLILGDGRSSWTANGIKENVLTSGGGQVIGTYCLPQNKNQKTGYTMFGCLDVNNAGFYSLGADNVVGVTPSARRPRLTYTGNYDIFSAESFAESQFFLNFVYLSKTKASLKNNNFSAVSVNGNYALPPLNILSFGTNATYFLNYGFLVTQAMFGVVYNTDITNEIGSSFYALYKQTAGKGLPSL